MAFDDATSRLIEGVTSPERDEAESLLAGASTLDLDVGAPNLGSAFGDGTLLVVESGFVVVRASFPPLGRSVVTVEAGPGTILLPPGPEEVLVALGQTRMTEISPEVRDRLLALPTVAAKIADELAFGLRQRQDAIAIFAPTHHLERVRRKLLQLARAYGHVVRDGVRIDFPISHALLAEMIGSSRETVTRAVDELQRRDFLAREGSWYRLLVSPGSLARAEGDMSNRM